jgi:ribose transport system permease protein
MISGVCAALGGFVSITQIGRVNANFGEGIEFQAIAAAILGGASLFGGIGTVFPGTVLGTIMVQMIQAGLIFINVDIYLQPIVQAIIIFAAVLIDSFRITQLKKLGRRHIMKV